MSDRGVIHYNPKASKEEWSLKYVRHQQWESYNFRDSKYMIEIQDMGEYVIDEGDFSEHQIGSEDFRSCQTVEVRVKFVHAVHSEKSMHTYLIMCIMIMMFVYNYVAEHVQWFMCCTYMHESTVSLYSPLSVKKSLPDCQPLLLSGQKVCAYFKICGWFLDALKNPRRRYCNGKMHTKSCDCNSSSQQSFHDKCSYTAIPGTTTQTNIHTQPTIHLQHLIPGLLNKSWRSLRKMDSWKCWTNLIRLWSWCLHQFNQRPCK